MTRPGKLTGIRCSCGTIADQVVDSRPTHESPVGETIRRRRECPACGQRVTTYEVSETHITGFQRSLAKRLAMELMEKYL